MKKILSNIDAMTIVFTIFALAFQIGIIVMVPFVFDGNVPVAEKNTVTVCFKPDKVEVVESRGFGRHSSTQRTVYFYNNTDKYRYSYIFFAQYDGENLAEDIAKEYLTVTSQKGTDNVVALKGENFVFYTLSNYNSSAIIGLILGIFIMILIEAIYLFIFGYYVFANYVPPYSYRGFAFNKIGIHIHNYQCEKYNIK